MTEIRTPLPPIRRQIVVRGDPGAAFTIWTEEIALWWPFERHSVYGAGATAAFVDGRLVERGPDGGEAVWGEVLDWSPPHGLRLTWHPGRDEGPATEVEVSFEAIEDYASGDRATLVTLVHRGWERLPEPAEAWESYDTGWPVVIARFGRRASGVNATPTPATSAPATPAPA